MITPRTPCLFRNLSLTFVLSILLPVGLASAAVDVFEPGYVVRMPADTIRGLIMIKEHSFNVRKCVFKETAESKEVTYEPGDIIAYGTAKKYFRSFAKTSPENAVERIFIEAIFVGRVSLFFNDDRYFVDDGKSIEELVEIEKELIREGKKFRVKQPAYQSTLLTAMKDCKTIHEHVVKTKLNRKDLLNLLEQYHKCIGVSVKTGEQAKEIAVRWGLSAGAQYSELHWDPGNAVNYLFMNVTPYPSTVSFTPSLWTELWRPGVNRFRARIGINYYSATYHSVTEFTSSGLSYDFTLATARVDFALQLKYLIGRKGLYAFGGFSVGKFISWDDKLIIRSLPSNSIQTEDTSLIMKNPVIQLGGGLGYDLPVGSRSIIFEADTRLTVTGISREATNLPYMNILAFTFSIGVPLTKNK